MIRLGVVCVCVLWVTVCRSDDPQVIFRFFLLFIYGTEIYNFYVGYPHYQHSYWPWACCWLSSYWSQIAKHRDKLLNYMLFLRVTPTLPNLFINLASPIVDIPFLTFFLATVIGIIPASYITVRVSFSTSLFLSFKFNMAMLPVCLYPLHGGAGRWVEMPILHPHF